MRGYVVDVTKDVATVVWYDGCTQQVVSIDKMASLVISSSGEVIVIISLLFYEHHCSVYSNYNII